ncbi:MAG: glycosyltransferase family 39 protein [Candidatus Korobacteraceae bacterium]
MGESRRGAIFLGVSSLLVILLIQLALTIRTESITWDEDDHLYAGYMSLKTGDFGLNPEHPPMVKMLAALPILDMPLRLPALQNREFKHEAFLGGKEFLFKNDADTMLFRARMAAASLTVLLALLVFLAGQEMFGTAAGFVALILLVFDPNQIAHGAFVTTDTGLTCFLFATVYCFYRFVKAPSIGRLLLVGLAGGLALASKHTGILIFPILLLLAICEWFSGRTVRPDANGPKRLGLAQYVLSLAVITVVSVTVLWAFYGFRYAARPAGLQLNPSSAEYIGNLSRPREAKLLATVARYHLLPESYIYGLADVRVMDDFYSSFLLGKTYPHGVWFYFPAVIVIKSTLSFLALLAIAIGAIATRKLTRWREILFLAIPPAVYLAVAMSSHMNIGVRHILPIYCFLGVLIGGAAVALVNRQRRWVYVFAALMLLQVATSLRAFPTYISYVNEAWGGQKNAWWLLSDSNADWAQQLMATKQYLDARGVKDCWFVYFGEGVIDTSYYGIPCKALPTPDAQWIGEKFYDTPEVIDGMVLISAGNLSGFEFGPGELNPYEQFKTIKPTGVIQNGIYVFEGKFEIPLAAAIGHRQKAQVLLAEGKLDDALTEAQRAVELDPNAVATNSALGDVLAALHRKDEARAAYERALTSAQTIHPEFQVGSIPDLQKKIAEMKS